LRSAAAAQQRKQEQALRKQVLEDAAEVRNLVTSIRKGVWFG
jgi:hypothetical protein